MPTTSSHRVRRKKSCKIVKGFAECGNYKKDENAERLVHLQKNTGFKKREL